MAVALIFANTKLFAKTPVSIELVLAVDTSLSVNDREYDLQMRGIAQAFRSPDIISLIGLYDGVAVTILQWGGWVSEENTVPWQVLKSPSSVIEFARQIEETKRENVGNFTAIGTAIDFSIKEIQQNEFEGRLRKIDVSGDGVNNVGPRPQSYKNLADQLGISINGLAIKTDLGSLDRYYRQNVITGPGSFVISATDYVDFAQAIHRKLKKELEVPIGWRRDVPAKRSAPAPQQAALPRSYPHALQ